MRRIVIVGALALLLLAASCGGDSDSPNGATQTAAKVETLSTQKALPLPISTPTAKPEVPGPEVRTCTASDINAAVNGTNAFTGGQPIDWIGLGNRSATACKMSRPPDIRFVDAVGVVLQVKTLVGDACPSGSYCIYQDPILFFPSLGDVMFGVPLKRGQASIMLVMRMHNGAGICYTPPPSVATVQLLLPDNGGTVAVELEMAPCDSEVRWLDYHTIS